MITPVSSEIVEQVRQEMAVLAVEGSPALMDRMAADQPVLLGYLLAVEGYGIPQDDVGTILYLGVAVWKMMQRGHPHLMRVSAKKLDQAEADNEKTLEEMQSDTPGDFESAALGLVDTYPEPEVLRYVVEALMEPDPEDVELSEAGSGIAFLHLKCALDALVRCRVG